MAPLFFRMPMEDGCPRPSLPPAHGTRTCPERSLRAPPAALKGHGLSHADPTCHPETAESLAKAEDSQRRIPALPSPEQRRPGAAPCDRISGEVAMAQMTPQVSKVLEKALTLS